MCVFADESEIIPGLKKEPIILEAACAQAAEAYQYARAWNAPIAILEDIVSRNGFMLGYTPIAKRTVKSIVLKAVKNKGEVIRLLLDKDISKDEEVMMSAIFQTPRAFWYIANSNREKAFEKKFLTQALKRWPEIFGSIFTDIHCRDPRTTYGTPPAPKEILDDPEIRLAARLFPLKKKS